MNTNQKALQRAQRQARAIMDAILAGQPWQITIEELNSLRRCAKRIRSDNNRVWTVFHDWIVVANNSYADGQTGFLAREWMMGRGINDVDELIVTDEE